MPSSVSCAMASAWDYKTDWVVVGSGSAGLTSALTASSAGLEALVIEKTELFGGTSALSGGVMWIPGNALHANDSADEALTYLRNTIGNRVSEARLRAFVEHAPKMLDHLRANGFLDVATFANFPDYRPEVAGGSQGGRSVEPKVFPSKKLGEDKDRIRVRGRLAPFGLVGTMTELRALAAVRTEPLQFLKAAARVLPRNLWNRISGSGHVANGAALVAWLRHALEKQGVPLWFETALADVVTEGDAVVGVEVERSGGTQRVRARRGVMIAAGGSSTPERCAVVFLATTRSPTGARAHRVAPATG